MAGALGTGARASLCNDLFSGTKLQQEVTMSGPSHCTGLRHLPEACSTSLKTSCLKGKGAAKAAGAFGKSHCAIERSLFWGSLFAQSPSRPQNARRFKARCKAVGTRKWNAPPRDTTFGLTSGRDQLGWGQSDKKNVSVAAKKSRSMGEWEDEEEGFQSLVKKMKGQQTKPPGAPAEKAPPQGSDPYADFAALLDYQDKNDGLLPPSRNTRPAPPSPVAPRPVEAVKPRVISRAGSRLSALSDIKVPTPRPGRKAGWGGNEAPSYKGYEEPNYKGYDDPSYQSGMPMGGVTEYKLGDSSAVQVSSQSDFPVRLKQHKVPKKGGGGKKAEEASEIEPVQIEDGAPETEIEQGGAVGLAALQAGGLGSAKPSAVKREEAEMSFLPGRGREYTVGEDDSDVSVVSASRFPVRTKSHREPKGGYSMGADVRGEVKVPPKMVRKRVPTYQELVSGAAKIVDTSLPPPAAEVQAAAKFDKVSGKGELKPLDDARPSDDISGPRVYSLGEDEGAFSVEAAESIPVRLKALKAEKTAGSAAPDNSKEKPGKVAQKVPGFKLPAEVRESGVLKKKKSKAGKEKDVGFRTVTTKAAEPSGGLFAAAKQFLTSRGLGSGDMGTEAIAQTRQLRDTLGEKVTSAQAEVIDGVMSLIEAKMLAESQGALIVPVMEGKVKLKGKKERAQVIARFPKWKEGYEKVCIDADYALRQLDGLAVDLGRSERSAEDQRSRRKERGSGSVEGVGKGVSAESTAKLAEKEESRKVAESEPSAVPSSTVEKVKMQSTEAEKPAELKEALPKPTVVSPSRKEPLPSSSRIVVEGSASVQMGKNVTEVGSSSGSPAKATQALGELALESEGTLLEAASSAEDDVEMGNGEAGDEPPNWEDDPEDFDLSAYESDSDDEQPEGEAKPEFEVKLPPPRAAPTEFTEKDAYETFAAMMGDDDLDDKKSDSGDGADVLEAAVNGVEGSSSRTSGLEEADMADIASGRPIETQIGNQEVAASGESEKASDVLGKTTGVPDTASNAPENASDDLEKASQEFEKASDDSRKASGSSGTASWDRASVSNQIFEVLRGTLEGESPPFAERLQGTKLPSGATSASKDAPLADRTARDAAQMPEDAIQRALDAVRTPPRVSEWSEEVQSAVARAEAEREMERRRKAPNYGAFDELLKEESGGSAEASATRPVVEEPTRATRPPTLKDQRAPFVRSTQPLKPAVPKRGPSTFEPVNRGTRGLSNPVTLSALETVVTVHSVGPYGPGAAADVDLAKKARWVRGLDDPGRGEDATRLEWDRAEKLAPNKETVEVLVVNYNSGGVQVLFGTLLGFIPASQLGTSRRPPKGPEWMGRALMPKKLRDIPREQKGGVDVKPPSQASGTPQRKDPFAFDNPDIGQSPSRVSVEEEEEEVDYIHSGIIPETDEQLAIAARQVKAYRTAHLASLVGQRLNVKVMVADRVQRSLIFSERAAEWREGQGEAMSKLLTRIKIGDLVKGTVRAITKYGAFIEVDGASCLIHKSEVAWVQPKHPGELLEVGQEVEALVVAVDRAINRVNCSLKRLQPDPLTETLDSLVERASAEGEESILSEMPELGDVIKLLEENPGVGEVRLGRRFRGTAFAPSFQIFLSEKVDNGYRLLARVGVEVQEVLVTTELERDTMKQTVRDATVSGGTERRLALADFSS